MTAMLLLGLFDDFYPLSEKEQPSRASGPTLIVPPAPAQIRQAQAMLSALGFDPGPADGVWGPQTESVIRQYQQRTGLPVTAALDNATMTALETETAKQRSESLSASDTSLSDLPQEITTRLGIELVLIPAGEFQMGSNEGLDDERPVHRVRISEPFYMGKYEVTQAQWEAVMGTNPSRFQGNPNQPVETVSWEDVQEFIKRLNRQEGWEVCRLPTEAQWEYAARAGTTTERYENDVDAIAWYSQNSGGGTHEVGQKLPNAWGLHDMLGNVWEWVQDWYAKDYYQHSPTVDPQGPDAGAYRVIRSGGWFLTARDARSADRGGFLPGSRFDGVGFRCLSSGVSQ